jgi:hypothetical protein
MFKRVDLGALPAAALVCIGFALSLMPPAAEAAGPPQIGAGWTASVATTSAGLRAEVNPNGLTTTYHFSYLSEAAYQANLKAGKDGFSGAAKAPVGADPSIGSSTAALITAQTISSLTVGTAYRYRVQATNSGGTTIGPSRVFFTESFAGATFMLDNRGWEMVSPPEKGGDEIQGFGGSFGGGAIQAAAQGSALTYSSTSSFGPDSDGAPGASQYIARRGNGGWASENISTPAASGSYGTEPDGVPYRLFSTDLARALMLNGEHCRGGGDGCAVQNPPLPGSGAPPGYQNYYLRESSADSFHALLGSGEIAGLGIGPEHFDVDLAGAASDLGQVVLSSCAALTPDATEVPLGEGCDPSKPNLYRWSGTGLHLVNLAPAASLGTPGAVLAAPTGAISTDGGRIYWEDQATGNLYLRESGQTEQVDAAAGGGGAFETAAADGSVAYYSKGGHLYRYDATADSSTDLTPSGGLLGVLGASASASRLYYLTAAGLFLREGAVATKIADAADASNYPPATGTARVSADGSHLAFLSNASLTGYDNRHPTSGLPLTEVFVYDTADSSLVCASCNQTGERPLGAASIPGAIANGSTFLPKPRSLSQNGQRLFFDSADQLAIQDTGSRSDVYEWEAFGAGDCARIGGCLALISRGRNSEGASFLDASASGSDVYFLTPDSLVGADLGFVDVYDAREGGGFPEPIKPIECVGDACQSLPSEPEDPTPGTLVRGSGNPPAHITGTVAACKRGFVRKHGRCVKKKPARKKHRRHGAKARGR